MIGVYKITNTKNGKVYIGQSVNIESRFKQHKKALRENNHDNCYLQDDWIVYGEDAFTFEVVQKCRSAYLDEIEHHLIEENQSTDREKGYNISAGSGRNLSVPSWYRSSVRQYGLTTRNESEFFRNNEGELEYNPICAGCSHDCKQSFRAEILFCPSLETQ